MRQEYITIIGRFASLNEYTDACRRNPKAGNNMKKAAEREIVAQLKAQRVQPFSRPIRIAYTFFETNKRRDKDNISGFFHKVFQDSLVKAHLIPDDGWRYIEGFSDDFDTDKHAHIEIRISEVKK